jgi:hypothetical protein
LRTSIGVTKILKPTPKGRKKLLTCGISRERSADKTRDRSFANDGHTLTLFIAMEGIPHARKPSAPGFDEIQLENAKRIY